MKLVQASEVETMSDVWLEQVEGGETLAIVRDGKVIAYFKPCEDGAATEGVALIGA